MKKKIVLISEALGGGVRRHIIDLLENLDKNKFEIYFMYNLDRADSIISEKIINNEINDVKLIEIKNFNREIGIKDIKAYISIYKELKKIKPDIVHCHSSKAGVLGRLAAKILGVKSIYYTPHAYYFQNPNSSKVSKKIYLYIESILSKFFTTKTINVSYGERDIALKYNLDKLDKFCVIYNGIKEIDEISLDKKKLLVNEFNIKDDDIVVGVIARLNHQKDPHSFIDIAKEITSKNNKVKFIYVGDGELYEEINLRVNNENIKNIILTGFRSDTDDILSIFDIFLTTALYEGMPYALIEACRAKLPIVATDIEGNREVVRDGYNGYLYNTDCIQSIAKLVMNIVESDEKYINFSKKSLQQYEEKFKLYSMIQNYENLYINNNIMEN